MFDKIKSLIVNYQFMYNLKKGDCFHISFMEQQRTAKAKRIDDVEEYLDMLESKFFRASLLCNMNNDQMFYLSRDKDADQVFVFKVPRHSLDQMFNYLEHGDE